MLNAVKDFPAAASLSKRYSFWTLGVLWIGT
jgi:hypothetical protein